MEELTELNILYEDNHIIVVEKKPNIPVCEDSSKDKDLLTIIKEYIKVKYSKPGNVYLGLVHRLDRPVGGVKEFAKTGQDSDAVSGLIAYTSHNENEIYTLDYGNRFTSQILYRLGYKWPITDDRYLESAIEALDRLAFFD